MLNSPRVGGGDGGGGRGAAEANSSRHRQPSLSSPRGAWGGVGGVGGSGGSGGGGGVTQDISVVLPPSEEEGKKHKEQRRRRWETLMRTRANARLEVAFFFLPVFSKRFQVLLAGERKHEINKEMNKSCRRVS